MQAEDNSQSGNNQSQSGNSGSNSQPTKPTRDISTDRGGNANGGSENRGMYTENLETKKKN
jgi:hypothetical protein